MKDHLNMKPSRISLAILSLISGITFSVQAAPTAFAAAEKVSQTNVQTKVNVKAHEKNQVTTQLPRNAKPSHYDISLIPNAKDATFSATAGIRFSLLEASNSITLHGTDLSIKKASLTTVKNEVIFQNVAMKVDAENQTLQFQFDKKIPKGEYRLALEYDGLIGTQAVGLFSLDYDTAEGKQRALYSQFENSDARRVFPGWDEPNFKATFTLDVTVPSAQLAVSNMPVVSKTDLGNGLAHIKFAPSPKMSTYLLFLSVGDFERATVMADGTEIGVVTKRGNLDQAQFVMQESAKILKDFNQYFGVKYPLPKLDNVAAPGSSQFFSAMENWGAIFTFETSILLDPAISTQGHKQNAFATAAHETAHQWFGNLVTMKWWDDLWLNEGFASWMENRSQRVLHPEWLPEFNSIGVREAAMGRDSIATTHPVVQHIKTVEEASQAFDTITYQKGEAVIHMLENYVGEDAWREGVRAYMKKHAYQNTASNDLWVAIEKSAKKPIRAIAKDFTEQPGVPLIRVEDVQCKDGKTSVSLTQSEYSKDQPNKKPLLWRVPVTAEIAGSKVQKRVLVENGKAKLVLPACGTVVVNAGQNGYYRTAYAPQAFQQIASNFTSINAIDQVGILNDAWALGMSGHVPLTDSLDLAKATPDNANLHVWANVSGKFGYIHHAIRDDKERQLRFRNFALQRLTPLMEKMGWEAKQGEPVYLANFRSAMIGTLSALKDPATLAEVRRRFDAMDTDAKAVPAELRMLITSIVASSADAATWDKLRARAQNEKSAMIKQTLYALLASTESKELAQRALDLALTDEPGLTTSANMIGTVSGEHPDLAFDFAIANKEKVNERIDATSRSRFFPGIASGSEDPAMIDKLKAYAKTDEAARREVDTAIARIEYRAKVKKERLPGIVAWVDKNIK